MTAEYEPHILTIFRTAKSPVNLNFVARDSKGIIADQGQGLALQGHYRRLNEEVASSPSSKTNATSMDCEDCESGRKLWSMRRRISSGSSSMRRRSGSVNMNPMSWFSPRRRRAAAVGPVGGYGATTAVAGAAAGTAAQLAAGSSRRRGTYMAPGSPYTTAGSSLHRRRHYPQAGYAGYGGSYHNPYTSYLGPYGYPSSTYASQMFGGRMPMATSYGYSGANAYSSGSGFPIALAAGAGLLASYAGSHHHHWYHDHHWYGYSQDDMYNMQCTSGQGNRKPKLWNRFNLLA